MGPVALPTSPETFTWLPRVAWSEDDPQRVYVAWQEIVFSGGSHGGEIFVARSEDGGRSFAAAENVSRSRAGDGKGRLDADTWDNGSLALAAGADRDVFVAWTEYEGALWIRRSRDGGARFEGAVRLGGSTDHPARGPSIALGRDRAVVHVAWAVGEDPNGGVFLATSRDGGATFGDARVVVRPTSHADAPAIATDERGVVHLAWAEGPRAARGRSCVYVATAGADATSGFSPPRAVSPEGEGAAFPRITALEEGRVVVSWERFPSGRDVPRGIGVAVSTDGGARFAVDPPLLEPPEGAWNGSQQGLFAQKLDARGREIVVANSVFHPGVRSAVLVRRGTLRR